MVLSGDTLACIWYPFDLSRHVSLIFATDRLARIPTSDQLVAHILTHIIKPFFAPSPHPRLHTSTARILPRPADVQDTYVEQPWKDHPGLDEVISWCLLNTEVCSVYRCAQRSLIVLHHHLVLCIRNHLATFPAPSHVLPGRLPSALQALWRPSGF